MDKIKQHLNEEMHHWEFDQQVELTKIKKAKNYLSLNVVAYIVISIFEFILAVASHSQTLKADAFNNLSGIISTILLMVGLHIASDINDDDVIGKPMPKPSASRRGVDQRAQFTRFRFETVFTLVTGVVMIIISLTIFQSGIHALLDQNARVVPKISALIAAIAATIIMVLVWLYNRHNGRKLNNAALLASAQDSLSDALTSLGTLISIAGAILFKINWLDGVASLAVGGFILYSGVKIFIETSFNLVDYFDPQVEANYQAFLQTIPQIKEVDELKAHYNGNVVTLDVVVVVDAEMSVLDSYRLAEYIEEQMHNHFSIMDVDVSFIPDDDYVDRLKRPGRFSHGNVAQITKKTRMLKRH